MARGETFEHGDFEGTEAMQLNPTIGMLNLNTLNEQDAAMLDRVQAGRASAYEVRQFTARMNAKNRLGRDSSRQRRASAPAPAAAAAAQDDTRSRIVDVTAAYRKLNGRGN